jgi:hypothetical protein
VRRPGYATAYGYGKTQEEAVADAEKRISACSSQYLQGWSKGISLHGVTWRCPQAHELVKNKRKPRDSFERGLLAGCNAIDDPRVRLVPEQGEEES